MAVPVPMPFALFRARKRAYCFLCNGSLSTSGDTWHGDIRALYAHSDRPDEVYLSQSTRNESAEQRTGWNTFNASITNGSFSAWWVPRAHNDHNCYDESDESDEACDVPTNAIKIPGRVPTDGLFGFLVHTACWASLQLHSTGTINLARLLAVLQGLQRGTGYISVDWAFAGDLLPTVGSEQRAGGPSLQHILEDVHLGRHALPYDYLVQPSPLDGLMPLVRRYIQKRWEGGGGGCDDELSHDRSVEDTKVDTFSVLCERGIVENILCYLPDKSVAALRRASRSVSQTPLRQCFWRSRFWTCNDLHLITEAWQADRERASDEYMDWRHLYHTMRDATAWQGLRRRPFATVLATRVRLSTLVIRQRMEPFKVVGDLYSTNDAGKPRGLADINPEAQQREQPWHWEYPNGYTRPQSALPVKIVLTTEIELKQTIKEMRLCFVRLVYPSDSRRKMMISGIRFHFSDETSKDLGYVPSDLKECWTTTAIPFTNQENHAWVFLINGAIETGPRALFQDMNLPSVFQRLRNYPEDDAWFEAFCTFPPEEAADDEAEYMDRYIMLDVAKFADMLHRGAKIRAELDGWRIARLGIYKEGVQRETTPAQGTETRDDRGGTMGAIETGTSTLVLGGKVGDG